LSFKSEFIELRMKSILFFVFFSFVFTVDASSFKCFDQEPEKKAENKSMKIENNNTTRPYRRKQSPKSNVKKERKSKT
jgi:hypothetical protein